ncbi:MAG: hypothetical protein ACREL7_02500 [Longimicrobiales bacterium]
MSFAKQTFPLRGRASASAIRIAALLALASACDPGDVILSDVRPEAGSGTAIEVQVDLAAGQSGPAAWSDGIPGATVYYARTGSKGFLWGTARADSSGHVTISGLEPGFYWIAGEASGGGGGAPLVVAGGEKVHVGQTDIVAAPVPVFTPREGSLAISEVYTNTPAPWVIETEGESKYVEVYNNSDHTILLDGKLIGLFYDWFIDISYYGHHDCADSEPLRNDSRGVWAHVIWRFPGNGGQYPLPPRTAAVLAVSGADHHLVHESFIDLSGADFEFLLPGLSDNPEVPNMESAGTRPARKQDLLTDMAMFLADAQDLGASLRVRDPAALPGSASTDEHILIPAATLLDVAFLMWDRYGGFSISPVFPLCDDPVFAGFDRLPGVLVHDISDLFSSIQRRELAPGVLLDTNVSRIDFVMRERTPGRIR